MIFNQSAVCSQVKGNLEIYMSCRLTTYILHLAHLRICSTSALIQNYAFVWLLPIVLRVELKVEILIYFQFKLNYLSDLVNLKTIKKQDFAFLSYCLFYGKNVFQNYVKIPTYLSMVQDVILKMS